MSVMLEVAPTVLRAVAALIEEGERFVTPIQVLDCILCDENTPAHIAPRCTLRLVDEVMRRFFAVTFTTGRFCVDPDHMLRKE